MTIHRSTSILLALVVSTPLLLLCDPSSADDEAATPATNRPRLFATPAGPSGYTLESGQFEIQLLGWDAFPLIMQYRAWEGVIGLGTLRYGISDRLTLNLEPGPRSLAASFRWRFYTTDTWSFSVQPYYATQFRSSSRSLTAQSDAGLAILSLAASREFNMDQHLHLSLELGGAFQNFNDPQGVFFISSPSSFPGNFNSPSQWNEAVLATRAAIEFEHRFNYRHGVSMWAAGQLIRTAETETIPSLGRTDYMDLIPTAGFAYHYIREIFWLMVGLELGRNLNLGTQSTGDPILITSQGNGQLAGNLILTLGWRF